ncbi:MAG: hypothetical protein ABDH20_11050 [Thermus sp.]
MWIPSGCSTCWRRRSPACWSGSAGAGGGDLIDINEAFAAQVLRHAPWADGAPRVSVGLEQGECERRGDRPGPSGGRQRARILVTLIYALRDRGLRRGIATLCLGGGEAVAMAVEVE